MIEFILPDPKETKIKIWAADKQNSTELELFELSDMVHRSREEAKSSGNGDTWPYLFKRDFRQKYDIEVSPTQAVILMNFVVEEMNKLKKELQSGSK